MENYHVVCSLGEGSFGRVYKAKRVLDSKFVALKVIGKRGRSLKEVNGLRSECTILKNLHHPNIIQMLDSFETENEIVVVTEFAHKELNVVLEKEGYLCEKRVQKIVWDLVSALFYLHSHRVLHRDLKPQNILLDAKETAKLCDFGFARNMSTGTHVLTSIKGTPLYMAPELIDEQPYDYKADLWSLGCIAYELLVGAPPFCTASILHLIRLIRHEQIQWPTFLSESCVSFLKGLLEKNPLKRISWQEILVHPFVQGHIVIPENASAMPLTRPMSANTLQAKEQQRLTHIMMKMGSPTQQKSAASSKTKDESQPSLKTSKSPKSSKKSTNSSTTEKSKSHDKKLDLKNNNLDKLTTGLNSLSLESAKSKGSKTPEHRSDSRRRGANASQSLEQLMSGKLPGTEPQSNEKQSLPKGKADSGLKQIELNFHEDTYPIENDEWIVFLQHSVEEVMSGEMNSLCQTSQTNILVSPLKNTNASAKVVRYVASLLCLPFVISGTPEKVFEQIRKTYFEVKLVPNLVYSSKLLMRKKSNDGCSTSGSGELGTEIASKTVEELTDDELQALEYVYMLICYLVHSDDCFLTQFCDAVVVLNFYKVLCKLLTVANRKLRIVTDLVAISTHILRKTPENSIIISCVLNASNEENFSILELLTHESSLLRERTCHFLLFLAKVLDESLRVIWNEMLKDALEHLSSDSSENIRNIAELALDEIKLLSWY